MMGGLVKDQNLETLLTTVDVFVGSASSLVAVFSAYDGDDFCAGLIFGQKGSHMLVQIAKTLVNLKQFQPGGNGGAQSSIRQRQTPEPPQPPQQTGGNKPNFRRWNG